MLGQLTFGCLCRIFLSVNRVNRRRSFESVPDFPSLSTAPVLKLSEPPATPYPAPVSVSTFPPSILPPEQGLFVVGKCVLLVLRPGLFPPDNRLLSINTDHTLQASGGSRLVRPIG